MGKQEHIWQRIGKGTARLHHAYGLSGPREEVLADILHFLEKTLRVSVRGNPDVLVRQFDTLSIGESRRIKELQLHRALSEQKVFIIAFNSATTEAQNALLKVLEEPAEKTHIFLVVPRLNILLPTVRSRLFTVEYRSAASSDAVKCAEEFLSLPVGKRLTLARDLADDVTDGRRDKQFMFDFADYLEQVLWERKADKKDAVGAVEEISLCRKYLGDRSASLKMLLEHLALVLPLVRR